MGTTISTIAGSLHDLRAMNEARARQRREVRLYLTGQRKGLNAVHVPYKADIVDALSELVGSPVEPRAVNKEMRLGTLHMYRRC